jgi:hypothetical protein
MAGEAGGAGRAADIPQERGRASRDTRPQDSSDPSDLLVPLLLRVGTSGDPHQWFSSPFHHG